MQAAPVQIGEMIEGKYRVEAVLGQGGMGIVLRARHVLLDHPVAIKVLFTGGPATARLEARFTREAHVAAKLKTEHAIRMHDTGVLPSGAPYLAMDFLEGKDLAALLKTRGALTVEEAVTYVLQACEVVAEAHVSGVVHRDLKPANLFLTKGVGDKPTIKVLDFGISKLRGDDQRLTNTGEVLGSPLYMSPEQMRAQADVDGRADIWALGVILYELLAERPPFVAETTYALMLVVTMEEPAPLAQYRPDVPPGLCAIIGQCLEKDRARRWPTVAAFAAALAPYAPPEMAGYVQRVSHVESVDVEPARSTDLLPAAPEPVPAPARDFRKAWARAEPSIAAPTSAQAPTPRVPWVAIGVVAAGLLLAVAVILGVRGRGDAPVAGPIAIPVPAPQPSTELAAEAPPPGPLPAPSTKPASTTTPAPSTPRPKPTAAPAPPASPVPAERAHRPPDDWTSRH